jgi:hypothetical protein
MKLRLFVFGLASAYCLYGQRPPKGFDFDEACFRNPSLPYCGMRDFVNKPAPATKGGKPAYSVGTSAPGASTTTDTAGIDWRFADPSADALAALNCSNLSATPLAHSLIDQLGSSQGLTPQETQNVFRALSSVNQVAISIRENNILILATGRAPDSILPASEAGWKAVPLGGTALMIGHTDAVDQALQRLATDNPLGDLAVTALQRTGDREFWAVWSAKMASPEAASAGVKRFALTASLRDRLTSDTVFEFDGAPDPSTTHAWMSTLGDAKIEGNAVRVRLSMEAEETRRSGSQIALSALGQRLGPIVKSARYLPMRDTGTAPRTKPVIFGLDGGPQEVH